jgi:hypothetical protein
MCHWETGKALRIGEAQVRRPAKSPSDWVFPASKGEPDSLRVCSSTQSWSCPSRPMGLCAVFSGHRSSVTVRMLLGMFDARQIRWRRGVLRLCDGRRMLGKAVKFCYCPATVSDNQIRQATAILAGRPRRSSRKSGDRSHCGCNCSSSEGKET